MKEFNLSDWELIDHTFPKFRVKEFIKKLKVDFYKGLMSKTEVWNCTKDELRSQIMPLNKKYPVADLLRACRKYVETTNRRITFEWALIKNFNDTTDHAQSLIDELKGMLCHINLIPLNPTDKFSGYAANQQNAKEFKSELEGAGIPCSIRTRRGIDIQAGCGQLSINDA